jgi:hypothetical protein
MTTPQLGTIEGVLTTYIGRDGKQYPIFNNSINLFHDAPEDKNPFAILYVLNNEIQMKGVINQETVKSLEREFGEVKVLTPNTSTTLN